MPKFVKALDWDGEYGSCGDFVYVVKPPDRTKGWRVWVQIKRETYRGSSMFLTALPETEEAARKYCEDDFFRMISSVVGDI